MDEKKMINIFFITHFERDIVHNESVKKMKLKIIIHIFLAV